jgi:Raf kinase inhibitor-like YbhB/YbcL family protein
MPRRYTYEGDDVSPPLEWAGVPEATKSLALIVDDPDALDPAAQKRVSAHWVLCNVPPNSSELAEGMEHSDLSIATLEGLKDRKKPGCGGTCPPVSRRRCILPLYAMDREFKDLGQPTTKARGMHVLGQPELAGTYMKRKSEPDASPAVCKGSAAPPS